VTDHNDVRSLGDLASAASTSGVIALPGYEHSLHGHAQLLGIRADATQPYDAGDQAADAVGAMAARLREEGGVFQANHPAYKLPLDAEYHACSAVSGQPPELGGSRLLLEAPGHAMVGDTVAPGAKLQVRAPGLEVPAVVRIRGNGGQLLEQPLDPGGTVKFKAPREAGWVRAILLARAALPVSTTTDIGDATPQRDGMPMLALTSPIYVRRPGSQSRLSR